MLAIPLLLRLSLSSLGPDTGEKTRSNLVFGARHTQVHVLAVSPSRLDTNQGYDLPDPGFPQVWWNYVYLIGFSAGTLLLLFGYCCFGRWDDSLESGDKHQHFHLYLLFICLSILFSVYLLQCEECGARVQSHFSHAWLFVTLWTLVP